MRTIPLENLHTDCIALSILCMSVAIAWEKDNPVIPEKDTLSEYISSTHFDYHDAENDPDGVDTTWQTYFVWLMDALDLQMDQKLEFYKYRDRAHLKRLTGRETNGFAEFGTCNFHTSWKIDNHESVHVAVTQLIGHPPALFNEGKAVAHQADYFRYPAFIPGWNGQDYHRLARDFQRNDELPPLGELPGIYTFWDYDSNITYPVSGAFVNYLIMNYGLAKMKAFISSCDSQGSKGKIRSDFQGIYAMHIDSIWHSWKEYIATYEGSQ